MNSLFKKKFRLGALLTCACLAAACSSSTSSSTEETAESTESSTLTLAAAASLETVMETEIIPAFEEEYNVNVEGVYDGSGKLVTQIENGLDADVFVSAGKSQMQDLVDAGYVSEDNVVDLLENQLVLIVPKGETEITSWDDLANVENVAIGDPESVPAGQYAKEALENLGLWDEVSAAASLGTNVTEVLSWVAAGSAPAGIVYMTDAAQQPDKVEVVAAVPDGALDEAVIYPAAVLNDAKDETAAKNFVDFLSTGSARQALEDAGFIVLAEE